MEIVVNRYANALLALTEAEGSAKLNLFFKSVLRNQLLKTFNYVARALDVARASDTYCYFHKITPLNSQIFTFKSSKRLFSALKKRLINF
jgi:hypothetical protein